MKFHREILKNLRFCENKKNFLIDNFCVLSKFSRKISNFLTYIVELIYRLSPLCMNEEKWKKSWAKKLDYKIFLNSVQCQGRKLVNSGQNLDNVVKERPANQWSNVALISRLVETMINYTLAALLEIQIIQHECNPPQNQWSNVPLISSTNHSNECNPI